MKKLSVLLVAALVALGAAAGNKIVDPKTTNVKTSEVKAKALDRQANTLKKGEVRDFTAVAVNPFEKNVRTTNHAFKSEGTLTWNFEDEAQLADWMVIDNDEDGYCWEWTVGESIKTHSGTGCMASASYDNEFGVLYPDNWLISPVVTLNGVVGFYACGQDPSWASENFAIYVCVGEPTSPEDFVKISEDFVATGVMTAYTADLSEYAGQEGCIAIRHYNVSDMFRLNVDDITIGEFEPETPPETPTIITEIPDGCQIYTYYRNSATIYSSMFGIGGGVTDGKFTVAFDTNTGDVYIQNPMWYYDTNGVWVKGTYDWMTGIITIPTGQYLSWSDAYQYGVVLGWGSTYVYEDGVDEETGEPLYYLGTEIDERTTEMQFMIEDDNIYLLGTEGDINAEFPENFNATGMYCYWSDDQSFTCIEFANRDENGYAAPFGRIVNLVPAVPADPTSDDWYDDGNESGFSKFYFTLPTEDVNGNPLDPECLSYSIFVDNGNGPEVFHFTGDVYTYDLAADEDITEVPYSLYSSAVDFHDYFVYMYRTNAEGYEPLFTKNIGIEVYYTVNGERNANENGIIWLYNTDTKVNELNANKTVANVRYFNAAGQEMAQPEGLTIKVTTYTDGTSSAVKVIK